MDRNLLQKEEDFHKQNEELELKTRRVLKEVEGMMVGTLLLKISFLWDKILESVWHYYFFLLISENSG